tara:strand:+ start:441 stop:644 length:204 start_codon:yes stop_codon:yes gene_type:complete
MKIEVGFGSELESLKGRHKGRPIPRIGIKEKMALFTFGNSEKPFDVAFRFQKKRQAGLCVLHVIYVL